MFTFEGIGIVLPLENKMKTPRGMPGWTGVLNTGMILVILNSNLILLFNCLLGPFIFTFENSKNGPTITLVLHTAWAHAL